MGARDNGQGRDEKKGIGSDYVPTRDSFSSQGESQVPRKLSKKETKDNSPRTTKSSASRQPQNKLQHKGLNNVQNKSQKQKKTVSAAKAVEVRKPEITRIPSRPPSELSEETDDIISDAGTVDDKGTEEAKEMDVLDEAPHCDQSTGTDDEIPDIEDKEVDHGKSVVGQGNGELVLKIDKLEQELREVAALEVSLYSVVPEHGSSAHKLHTPARRLSRLYIHASKFWSEDKRASVAKSIASGLVLVAKSSSNDASRLIFWLSNTVVLREIIVQTFGISHQFTPSMTTMNMNGGAKKLDGKSMTMLWRNNSNGKQDKLAAMQMPDDWQETSTLLAALEKIESWIFSRIVETVWWQALTPHMQKRAEGSSTPKAGRVLGPALGDQQQGTFSVNLWKAAFHDAFSRMCPLRAGGHECGCLPVLAKLVMEQCVARLDVAMFNAILRESASEIPTDPISDPIVDPKVLPIPAGDLSFGSGAQLKNSIGNWSRWLTDKLGIDDDDSDDIGDVEDERRGRAETKSFQLLNELSDLLMLPKDMLLEKSIRKEICPSIGLQLVTRILCNFTPDEFCPDAVPSTVLEELNSEDILGCGKFKKKGLENEDDLAKCFADITTIGIDHWSPHVVNVENVDETQEEATNFDPQDDDVIPETQEEDIGISLPPASGKRLARPVEKSGKKAKSGNALLIQEAVNSMASSANEYVSKRHGKYSIDEVMEVVIACGADYDSNEHYIATELFVKKEQREMFMTLPTNEIRFTWLRRKYNDKYDK